MGLYVSTTGTNVTITELGITLTHPTTNYDLSGQFSAEEIRGAASLTSSIGSGTLTWKKTSGGPTEAAADYDPDWMEAEELNLGSGASADRVVTFKDLPPGSSFGSPVALTPDSGNVDGVATSVARSDHKHDMPTVAPSTIGTANAEGTANTFVRSDHIHDHGSQSVGTHHAVATTSVNGFMSAADKTKLDALRTKAGRVSAGTFAGNPKKATVTFTTAFASTNYTVNVTGADARSWTIESKAAGSFVINANANAALTGEVMWQAQIDGEVG